MKKLFCLSLLVIAALLAAGANIAGSLGGSPPPAGGGPTVVATDDFVRADAATLGSNWTNDGTPTWTIQSNRCSLESISGFVSSFWNANTFANNQYSKFTVNAIGSAIEPTVRGSVGNFYAASFDGATCQIYKYVATVETSLGSPVSVTVGTGDVISLEANGTSIIARVNGTIVNTQTDASLTSGRPGLNGYSAGNGPPNGTPWEGGNL